MRRIGYLRVSTRKQKHDRQVHILKRYCDRLFIETASAKSLDRPVYEKVTRLLDSGDELVVLDIDRAYRNTRDALNQFHILSMRGVRMQVLNFPIDPNTDEGYYSFVLENARAELERRKISRRTREGLAVARANGKVLGRPRKLDERQIAEARKRLRSAEDTITGLAKKYNVGRWTLSRALRRCTTARTAHNPTDAAARGDGEEKADETAQMAATRAACGMAELSRKADQEDCLPTGLGQSLDCATFSEIEPDPAPQFSGESRPICL